MDENESLEPQDAAPAEAEATGFQANPRTLAYIRGDSAPAQETPAEPVADEQASLPADEVAVATEGDDAPAEDAAEVAEVADEPVDEALAPWFDQNDATFAQRYGWTDYDLAQFSSRGDMLRAAHAVDRTLASQQQPAATEVAAAPKVELTADDGPYDKDGNPNLAWWKENRDEADVRLVEGLQKQREELAAIKQQNEAFQQYQQELAQQQYVTALHDAVDSLGRRELYGASVVDGRVQKLAPAELARRGKLNEQVGLIADYYARTQQPSPPLAEIVKHAESIVFRDEIAALEAKKSQAAERSRLEKIAKQATRRRPVAAQAGATSAVQEEADPNSPEAILRRPAFAKWRREKAEEYGDTIS
jgi:hypothetical protein